MEKIVQHTVQNDDKRKNRLSSLLVKDKKTNI